MDGRIDWIPMSLTARKGGGDGWVGEQANDGDCHYYIVLATSCSAQVLLALAWRRNPWRTRPMMKTVRVVATTSNSASSRWTVMVMVRWRDQKADRYHT